MPQHDVYRLADGALVVDCQANSFANIDTRIVVPLVPIAETPKLQPSLNPIFEIGGEQVAMLTQFATALRQAELRRFVTSLAAHRFTITGAFDRLLTGV